MSVSLSTLSWRVLGLVVLLFLPAGVQAASLYIDPPFSSLHRGDTVTLAIRLDVDEAAFECVNAVDGVLTYSEGVEPVDVSIGDSIFNVWVEQPVINRENRTITFAGGIPNGYCGRVAGDPRLTNILTKVVFRSPGFSIGGDSTSQTEATVSFAEESAAYLNDGEGTRAPLATYAASIELHPHAGSELVNPWQEEVSADTIPPEEFSIILERSETAFNGRYYVIFNTSDKQTGIDQYQIMEEPLVQFGSFQWGRADAPWITARSPYVLKDQSLNSIIRVKAVDKAGNEYIANLIPDESMRTLSQTQTMLFVFGVAAVVLLLVIAVVVFIVLKRRRAGRALKEGEVKPPPNTDSYEDV